MSEIIDKIIEQFESFEEKNAVVCAEITFKGGPLDGKNAYIEKETGEYYYYWTDGMHYYKLENGVYVHKGII